MKRLIASFALCFAMGARAQTVTIAGQHLGGSPGITGTITFQPNACDAAATPASARIGIASGQSSRQPITARVTAGAFTATGFLDTSLSNPANLCYAATARTATGLQVLGPGYTKIQPAASNSWCSNGVCDFDAYTPAVPPLPVTVQGPPGTPGKDGDNGQPGTPGCVISGSSTCENVASLSYTDATRGGVWQRIGTVVRGEGATGWAAQEATVLYDPSPKLLPNPPNGATFSVFKMWYVCGWTAEGLCYAESYDGISWTHRSTPVIPAGSGSVAHGFVMKDAGQYVFYGANDGGSATSIDRWTSPDGLAWTLADTGVITRGTGSAWDNGPLGNVYVVHEGSTYYMVYEASSTGNGIYVSGVATSPDGITWAKYAGNPIIQGPGGSAAGGPELRHINGVWYMWGQGSNTGTNQPTDIYCWGSTDFHTWTLMSPAPVFGRQTFDEGVDRNDNFGGQVADPTMVEVNGKTYLYYSAIRSQDTPTASNNGSHIKLAIAQMSIEQLLTTPQGSAAPVEGAQDSAQPNFYRTGFYGTPYEDDNGEYAVGNSTLSGGSYPQMCLNCYYDPSVPTNRYGSNGLAATWGLDKYNTLGKLDFYSPGLGGQPLPAARNIFVYDSSGLGISRVRDYFGLERASGPGCALSGAGSACGAVVTLSQAFPDTSYTVFGCTIAGGSAAVTLGRVTSQTPTQFSVDEMATSSGATGGGTVNCLVMAN